MSGGLKKLKDRRISVQSTAKITSAMKLIAMARLYQAQEKSQCVKEYLKTLKKVVQTFDQMTEVEPSRLFQVNEDPQSVLLIVLGTGKGFCGAYNNNLVKLTMGKVWDLQQKKKNFKILCFGNKVYNKLMGLVEKDRLLPFEIAFEPRMDFDIFERVIKRVVTKFSQGLYDRCEIIYNRFINILQQEAVMIRYLPLVFGEESKQENHQFIFEPTEEAVVAETMERYYLMEFYSIFLESNASEHAARVSAMDNATRNAQDMIKELTLKANRLRQANITKELIEIISGAEAL